MGAWPLRQQDDSGDAVGSEPDYRFTLANERTYLAWIRTALALIAGAVAVLHLVELGWPPGLQTAVGVTLAVLAVIITVYAPVHWIRVQRAMWRDGPLPASVLPITITVGVVIVCGMVLVGMFW